MTALLHRLRRIVAIATDRGAIGAVEFALIAPFLILLYVGSYQLMDAISAYRKVTVTARTLADLTTLNDQLTPTDASAILDGARQVMTPYSTTNSTLVIAEIAMDDNAAAKIVWVCASDNSPKCSTTDPKFNIDNVDLPASLKVKNTAIVFSNITFDYVPVVAASLIGPLKFSDHIFMNPRRSPSICLNDSGNPDNPHCIGEGTS